MREARAVHRRIGHGDDLHTGGVRGRDTGWLMALSIASAALADAPLQLVVGTGKDAKTAIRAFATNAKQGKRLDDAFVETGVTFVPVAAK